MSQKELVRKLLRGREISRPPFIPLLGTYLTKVDQTSVEELLTEPGALFSGLIHTQQLFGLDAVTLPVDIVLEAEAFGIPIQWDEMKMPAVVEHIKPGDHIYYDEGTWLHKGRIPVFLEAAKRFVAVHGKTIPLFATMSGPVTVLQQIYGDKAIHLAAEEDKDMLGALENISQALISLCKSYGELKIDGVIINDAVSLDSIHPKILSRYYNPIFTVLRFYNTTGLLKIPPSCQTFPKIQSGGILSAENVWAMPDSETHKGIKGISLSSNVWSKDIDLDNLRNEFKKNGKKSVFITTVEPLHLDIDLNRLHTNIPQICEEASWIC